MSELEILYPQIPFNALSVQESDATQTGFSSNNLSTGSRSLIHKLSTPAATITNTWKQWDLGVGYTDSANYLAIARADLLRAAGCTSAIVRASTVSRNTITDLALSSLKLWLDASKEITIDSVRRVSAWGDQSGNSFDFVQATDANKPVLSRADNKENLIQYSEQIDNAAWTKTRSNVTANAAVSPLSVAQTADLLYDDNTVTNSHAATSSTFIAFSGLTYRFSVYAKRNGRDIAFGGTGFAGSPTVYFNLTSGTVHSQSGGATGSIESVGNSWYRCTMTALAGATGTSQIIVFLCSTPGTDTYSGDGVSGTYLFGAQVSESTADTTYVLSTDHLQYKGINGYPSLVFDTTNDLMTSTATLTNIITNSAATVFFVLQTYDVATANVRYFRDTGAFFRFDSDASGGDLQFTNNDGAADSITRNITTSTVYIAEARHDTGTIYLKLNNGTETSVASGNTSTLTGTLELGDSATGPGCKIAELLVFNAALTAAQRSSIYTYLATKYTTAAAGSINIESATLVGPHEQDLITTFTATSQSRYYWLDLFCNTPSTTVLFPFSKAYLGTRYSFDSTDPVYPYETNYRKPQRDFTADSGSMFRSREGREQLIYGFNWFIDDSTRDDFMEKIGKYWDINPIMLYTTSANFDAPLNGNTLVHGWIDSIQITGGGPVANQNRLKLEVIQDV